MIHWREIIDFLGGFGLLCQQTWRELWKKPFYLSLWQEQIYAIGVRSTPLILIVAASTGMVMALQFGVGLEKFGGRLYVPKFVSLSIVRELGPVFASLMLAARIGAGITSEVGSMRVTQQIDAIRALGTSPIKKIVIPRLLASLVAFPVLAVAANTVGILGGLIVGMSDLNLDPYFYYNKFLETVRIVDYLSGFFKVFFFAFFIAMTACYFGLNAGGGTQGVGRATTHSVVVSSIMVVIGDYFLTKFFLIFEYGFN